MSTVGTAHILPGGQQADSWPQRRRTFFDIRVDCYDEINARLSDPRVADRLLLVKEPSGFKGNKR